MDEKYADFMQPDSGAFDCIFSDVDCTSGEV
jgi:hypothetical protein